MDDIETIFLCQGCQTDEQITERLVEFVNQATRTIDISIYSFSLCPESRDMLVAALRDRAKAGVDIRIAYDAGSQQPMVDEMGTDFCDVDTPDFVKSLGFPSKAIEGYRALMHDKYVLLDAAESDARIWTGSSNFTEESWTLQENNIILLRSEKLAGYFAYDFNELWVDSNIAGSNVMATGEDVLQYHGEPAEVMAHFSPIEGEWIDENLAERIKQARQRLTLATVVLTSGRIINAIQELMRRDVPIDGIYDYTQMEEVKRQWQDVPSNHWKIPAFEEIVAYGHLAGKHSTPYTPTSTHDFMHNKVMVADDTVITGSYNFSRHAQFNAENILMIKSEPLAATYRQYIAKISDMYRNQPPKPQDEQLIAANKTTGISD